MKPHVHKDLIIAWANGAEIQWFSWSNSKQEFTWADCKGSPEWRGIIKYRIKPKILFCKRYLHLRKGGFYDGFYDVDCFVTGSKADWETLTIERGEGFIRWIDTEWQEVEV